MSARCTLDRVLAHGIHAAEVERQESTGVRVMLWLCCRPENQCREGKEEEEEGEDGWKKEGRVLVLYSGGGKRHTCP